MLLNINDCHDVQSLISFKLFLLLTVRATNLKNMMLTMLPQQHSLVCTFLIQVYVFLATPSATSLMTVVILVTKSMSCAGISRGTTLKKTSRGSSGQTTPTTPSTGFTILQPRGTEVIPTLTTPLAFLVTFWRWKLWTPMKWRRGSSSALFWQCVALYS